MTAQSQKFWAVLAWLILSVVDVQASTETQTTSRTLSMSDAWHWFWALLFVLMVFFLFAWMLKRISGMPMSPKAASLSILSNLPLGMRERLVLVKVGDKQLLLGVTQGRIDKLMELEGDERLFMQTSESEPGLFGQKLRQVMQGNHDQP